MSGIVAELAAIDLRKAELSAALDEAKGEFRYHIIKEVANYITSNGFTVEEIASALLPKPSRGRKRQAGKSAADGGRASYPVYALRDDLSKTYTRGVLPAWLKLAMTAVGLDPSMGSDRAKFKEEHMTLLSSAA